MIIETIVCTNFRSLLKVTLECATQTTIVGRNGSGKSSLLKALEVFYSISYQANDYDYFAKDPSREIRISVTYADLRADEAKTFGSYLSPDGKLTVTKIITKGGVRYVGVTKGVPQFEAIRQIQGATDKKDAFNELIEKGELQGLSGKAKNGADALKKMQEYEAANVGALSPIEKSEQFLGAANVGAGSLDNYTRFVLVPAVRDAAAETNKKGMIHELIEVLVGRSLATKPEVQDFIAEFEAKAQVVYGKDGQVNLSELAADLTKLLALYAPGAVLDLEFDKVSVPTISLPGSSATIIEHEFKCPIQYCGHGVQRALVLALLQKMAFIAKQTPNKEGEAPDAISRPPDLILAIEEPELYLHPSRSRYLSRLLREISTKPADPNAPRIQVLYATHSPYFIDLDDFQRVRVARKAPCEDVKALQCALSSFSEGDALATLSMIHQIDPAELSAEGFIARASSVMTPLVNEGFFADVVVVVEGPCEVGVLSTLQQIKKKNWEAKGIVIVSAEGKSKIDRPVIIFQGLGITTYNIFDGDADKTKADAKKDSAKMNRAYQRMNGVTAVEDFPKTGVHANWAVFEISIEAELKAALGEADFVAIRSEIANKLGLEDLSRLFKNGVAAASFIQSSYDKGKTIPVLEGIVDAITALAPAS